MMLHISTTYRCCGSNYTVNADNEQAGSLHCPACGGYLWGKLTNSITQDEGMVATVQS